MDPGSDNGFETNKQNPEVLRTETGLNGLLVLECYEP